MQKFIVDGYNVIHADPELKRVLRSDLEAARRRLVRRLILYLETKNVCLTVVFDGHGGIADVEVEIPGRLQLMYSPTGQSADDLILEMLELSTNPREYVVVTSDMADIGRVARSLGAVVLPSAEFLSRIETNQGESASPPETENVDDVDYWLKRFSGDQETDRDE